MFQATQAFWCFHSTGNSAKRNENVECKIHKSAMQKYFRDFMLELLLLIYYFFHWFFLKSLICSLVCYLYFVFALELFLFKVGKRGSKENLCQVQLRDLYTFSLFSKSIKMYQYSINVEEFCGEKRGGCVLG